MADLIQKSQFLRLRRERTRFLRQAHFDSAINGRINIRVPRESRLMSMTLSQPSKRQRLLTNHVMVPLLAVPKKEQNVSKMTDAAAPFDLSEKEKEGWAS